MNTVTKEEYWSIILNDPAQIGQITTEDTEFNRRINDVNLVLSNTFINTSDENLISNWETSLYIDGIEGKTLTERKADILYTLCEKNYVPVSIIKRFLLNLIGDENKFVIEFIKDENKLVIHTGFLDDAMLSSVDSWLDRVVPQNVEVERNNYILPVGYKGVEYLEVLDNAIQTLQSYIMLPVEIDLSTDSFAFETEHELVQSNENQAEGSNIFKPMIFYGMRTNGVAYYGFGYANGGGVKDGSQVTTGYNVFRAEYDKGIARFLRNSFLEGQIQQDIPQSEIIVHTIGVFCAIGVPIAATPEAGSAYPFNGRKKYFKVWVNDELKCHLTPALDSTGAPCMFDLVSYTPFYTEGTGDFTYPTERTTYSLRRVLPDWGQLTPHGLRRLYHVPEGYTGELIDYALENGFKPIVESEKPEEGYWSPHWTETQEEIILEWVETEPPSTEDFNLEQPTEI